MEKFPNFKSPYEEEKIASWKTISEIETELHPYPKDPFILEIPGSNRPTHFTVKVPPNTMVVYYPKPSEHTIFSHFRPGEIVLYLGEVQHMKNHGVFVDRTGKVQYGYHTWCFRVIPEEEV